MMSKRMWIYYVLAVVFGSASIIAILDYHISNRPKSTMLVTLYDQDGVKVGMRFRMTEGVRTFICFRRLGDTRSYPTPGVMYDDAQFVRSGIDPSEWCRPEGLRGVMGDD